MVTAWAQILSLCPWIYLDGAIRALLRKPPHVYPPRTPHDRRNATRRSPGLVLPEVVAGEEALEGCVEARAHEITPALDEPGLSVNSQIG